MTKSINPKGEQIKALANFSSNEPIVMINLLKFKEKVEDSNLTGEQAYREYAKKASPFINKVGGKVIWQGKPQVNIIAPQEEVKWDEVILVEYQSKENFLQMISFPDYPHEARTKSLEDSRLIACTKDEIGGFK